jgi:hypothetical protein
VHVQADPVGRREAAPVSEQHGHLALALLDPTKAQVVRDARVLPIRPEDPPRPEPAPVVEDDAAYRVVLGPGTDQPGDLVAQDHRRTGLFRKVDEHGVETDPAHRQGTSVPADRREGPRDFVTQYAP